MIRIISLLLFLIFTKDTAGQANTNSIHSKLKKTQGKGVYGNLHCSLLDKAGNLWFGSTDEGVYRYDGKEFRQFTVNDGLSNNTVWCMTEDNTGLLWFGTNDGISCYDGKTISRIAIKTNSATLSVLPKPATEKCAVWSIMQDRFSSMWFGTSEGVYCYKRGIFLRLLDDKGIANPKNLSLKMVDDMMEDSKGNIWFCSGMEPGEEGICKYDRSSVINYKPYGDGWIRNMFEDKNGLIYIATRRNGMCRYDAKSDNFINITAKSGIDNSSITFIMPDKSGNIWIATEKGSGQMGEEGGVWKYDGKSFKQFTTKDGLVHNGVFTIVEDRSGNIWFGTRNNGLSRFDGKSFVNFSE